MTRNFRNFKFFNHNFKYALKVKPEKRKKINGQFTSPSLRDITRASKFMKMFNGCIKRAHTCLHPNIHKAWADSCPLGIVSPFYHVFFLKKSSRIQVRNKRECLKGTTVSYASFSSQRCCNNFSAGYHTYECSLNMEHVCCVSMELHRFCTHSLRVASYPYSFFSIFGSCSTAENYVGAVRRMRQCIISN